MHVSAENQRCFAFHSIYASGKVKQPPHADHEQFISWLRALDARFHYALLIPATELSLLVFRALPQADPLRLKAVLPSDDALDVTLDKHRTWCLASRLGIPVPSSVTIRSLDEVPPAERFPVVLKPIRSKVRIGTTLASASAAIIGDDTARMEFLRTWLQHVPIQQQDYIEGCGIGVEFLYGSGVQLWHFAHERIHEFPLTGGGSSYRRSIRPPDELLAAGKQLLDILQWHGVAMVEFKVRNDGTFYLMEVNPRLWGSLALPIDVGVNFPLALLQIAVGETPRPQPAYRVHYYARNLTEDPKWLRA